VIDQPGPTALTSENPVLRIGTMAAALYLGLLPFNHLTAAKNLSLAIAFVCALLLWLKAPEKRVPLVPVFAVWLAAAAMSLLWTHDAAASLIAIWRDVVKTALIFFGFFVLASNRASIVIIVRISIIGASIFASLAIYELIRHGLWGENFLAPARYDISVDALNWIVFIVMMVPTIQKQPTTRLLPWLGLFASALLIVAGVMTQSRSFNLAIILGAVLVAAMNFRRMLQHKTMLALVSGVIVASAILGVTLLNKPLTTSWDRWLIYSTVWQKIVANPWHGTGFGHETDQAWYRNTFDYLLIPDAPAGLTHPHNIVLSYLDQMGIWGFLVLAFMFWTIGRKFWSAMHSGDQWQAWLGQAGMLLLLVTLLSNSFNYFFARQHLWMFFAMLGLYLGWIRGGRRLP